MNALVKVIVSVVVILALAEIMVFATGIMFQSQHPPVDSVQRGPRGTGMIQLYNPRDLEHLKEANKVPVSVPYAGDEGPKAGTVYENVKVLGDVSVGEFTRLMVNMTTWVAKSEGCAGCHNVANFADDSLYTKVVARRMLEMVRHINADWTSHVADTGVTCYTCHRGQLVPPNVWFNNPGPAQAHGVSQVRAGQNHPAKLAGGSALPLDPLTAYLEGKDNIRIQSLTPLRQDNKHSIKQAEHTYALMMSFSQSLGVNCDYCHNTRSFFDWKQSPPQRVKAWHGIRMVRDINQDYLGPLKKEFPAKRLGALGDGPKVSCATCHNGAYKPLFGVSMLKDFPELKGIPAKKPAAPTAAAPSSSAPTAAVPASVAPTQ